MTKSYVFQIGKKLPCGNLPFVIGLGCQCLFIVLHLTVHWLPTISLPPSIAIQTNFPLAHLHWTRHIQCKHYCPPFIHYLACCNFGILSQCSQCLVVTRHCPPSLSLLLANLWPLDMMDNALHYWWGPWWKVFQCMIVLGMIYCGNLLSQGEWIECKDFESGGTLAMVATWHLWLQKVWEFSNLKLTNIWVFLLLCNFLHYAICNLGFSIGLWDFACMWVLLGLGYCCVCLCWLHLAPIVSLYLRHLGPAAFTAPSIYPLTTWLMGHHGPLNNQISNRGCFS